MRWTNSKGNVGKQLSNSFVTMPGSERLRTALARAVSFLCDWSSVTEAELLQTVPARLGVAGWIIDERRQPLLTSGLLDPDFVFTALKDLPWLVAYDEARGAFMNFNAHLLVAHAGAASPVATDEIGWRYLSQLLRVLGESSDAASRAHWMVQLAPLPGIAPLGPADALRLHTDADDFAEWHIRLRRLGREMPSLTTDSSASASAARELLEEELGPAIRRLDKPTRLAAVRSSAPTQGLSMVFGAAGLGLLAVLGLPVTEAGVLALPISGASQLAIAALGADKDQDSAVLARLVQVDRRNADAKRRH